MVLLQFLYLVGLVSIPALLVGGLILDVAIRLRLGGWITALLTGSLVALAYARFGAGLSPRDVTHAAFIAILGLPYSGVFWLALRLQVPQAFTR
ncbi:MAG: hypothetical protein V7661_07865 [Sulfitobacter sp.]